MICVGIDVAKDKHDCFILSSEGEVLADVFTIPNNAEGFDLLLQTIHRCTCPADIIKVGLEVPQSIELIHRLNTELGFCIPLMVYDMDTCAELIKKEIEKTK